MGWIRNADPPDATRSLAARLLPAAAMVAVAAAGAPSAVASAPAITADSGSPLGPPQFVPDQLIVGFKPGVSSADQKRIIEGGRGKRRMRFGPIRAGLVRPRSGVDVEKVRKAMLRNPDVEYVERDVYVNLLKTPNDPLVTTQYQYGLSKTSSVDIDATEAWGEQTKCTKVAVLDTGVDTDHPDLKDNLWKNSKETSGNGRDDDGNGYVDDVYGADVLDRRGSGEDDNGHGTHVAGIIAGKGNNSSGVAGICWSDKLVSVKFMNQNGVGTTSGAISALDYAVDRGAKIVNASFGSSSKSNALEDAIDEAKEEGVLIVAAAGNDGQNIDHNPVYPASYTDSNILVVAASTSDDGLASFSNYGGNAVDLGAPGENIVSTYIGGTYSILSGTSMATPMVAGSAALLRKENSDASYKDIRSALRKKVDKVSGLKDKVYSDGRLNVDRALDKIKD